MINIMIILIIIILIAFTITITCYIKEIKRSRQLFDSIKINSKWLMVIDEYGWPLLQNRGILNVVDKVYTDNKYIIICSNKKGELFKYYLEDFITGTRIC